MWMVSIIYAWIWACLHARARARARTHTHTHTHMHARTRMRMCAHVCACNCAHMCVHLRSCYPANASGCKCPVVVPPPPEESCEDDKSWRDSKKGEGCRAWLGYNCSDPFEGKHQFTRPFASAFWHACANASLLVCIYVRAAHLKATIRLLWSRKCARRHVRSAKAAQVCHARPVLEC